MTPHRHQVLRMVENVLGCKWMLLILDRIRDNVTRPGALERAIPGLSTKVLNERLRKLVDYGILEKKTFRESPPRVEYHLTDFGRRLTAILDQIETIYTERSERRVRSRRR